MLINGKEVEYDPKYARQIQRDVDATKNLPDELKQQLSKQELLDVMPPEGVDVSNNSFGWFGEPSEEGLRDRKERYDTYREMDQMVFIHRALETIVDDAVQRNDEGNVLKIMSDSEEIKERLEDLFNNRLDFNKELWSIIYETIKMGDNFYEVIPDSYEKPTKIAKIRYLEPYKMERVEVNNKLAYFIYRDEVKDAKTNKKMGEVEYRLQPWQILHFKIDNKEFDPYGGSLLHSGVRTYRRLSLLEDVMVVYRLSRSPERRVFYVDVGQLSSIEAKRFLQKFRDNYRTQQFIDENGKINRRAQVLSVTSDIFIPVREGGSGTKIDTLQSGNALNSIDDLKYFKEEILMTMNIPPAYIGADADRSRGSLAMIDQKFSKYIERIQGNIINLISKLAALDLFFAGYKKEDLYNFKLELTPPSNVKEITDLEFFNQKIGLISNLVQLNLFPTKWVLKKVLRLSDKEIADIMLFKELEDQKKNNMGLQGQDMSMAGGAGGIGMPMEVPGQEMPGAQAPELGGAENQIPQDATGGQEAPAVPEQLTAGTIIDLLGKEFLLENQEDFFTILKAIEDNKNNKTKVKQEVIEEEKTLIQAISKFLLGEEETVHRTGNMTNLLINNEFGGLTFSEKSRAFSYFKEEDGKFKEKTVSLLLG